MESNYLIERRKVSCFGNKNTEVKKVYTIPKESKKRKVINRTLRKIVKEEVEKDPHCKVNSPECTGIAQGSNHKQKRSPKNIIDRSNLEMSCNACNSYCERFPKWAASHGHQISRFVKNKVA